MSLLRESLDASDETSHATRDPTSSSTNPSDESNIFGSRSNSHSTGYTTRRMMKRQSKFNATSVNQANSNSPFNGNKPFFVQDNNPLLHYEGVWTLSGSNFFTTHSTTVAGSSLSLRFNGTGIGLFGTVPESNATVPPPTAIFRIDQDQPFETTLPLATVDIPNQPIFATVNPLSAREHILTINVTAASSPFTVARFIVFPNFTRSTNMQIGQPSVSVSTAGSRSTQTSSSKNQNKGHSTTQSRSSHVALAATLGVVSFLLIGAAIAVYIVWRKRRRQARMKADTYCPAAANARPDTVYTSFTSTESIRRNNSGLWSSSFRSPDGRSHVSRSEGGRSNVDMAPPPLPPKPSILNSATKPG